MVPSLDGLIIIILSDPTIFDINSTLSIFVRPNFIISMNKKISKENIRHSCVVYIKLSEIFLFIEINKILEKEIEKVYSFLYILILIERSELLFPIQNFRSETMPPIVRYFFLCIG